MSTVNRKGNNEFTSKVQHSLGSECVVIMRWNFVWWAVWYYYETTETVYCFLRISWLLNAQCCSKHGLGSCQRRRLRRRRRHVCSYLRYHNPPKGVPKGAKWWDDQIASAKMKQLLSSHRLLFAQTTGNATAQRGRAAVCWSRYCSLRASEGVFCFYLFVLWRCHVRCTRMGDIFPVTYAFLLPFITGEFTW